MDKDLTHEIAVLPTLNRAQLLLIWKKSFSQDPPAKLRKELMVPIPGLSHAGEGVRRSITPRPKATPRDCPVARPRQEARCQHRAQPQVWHRATFAHGGAKSTRSA